MRILALAYLYPPQSGSGTFRSLYFLNRIAQSGDAVVVLTACEVQQGLGSGVDPELSRTVDPRIEIIRASVANPVHWLVGLRNRLRKGARAAENSAARAVHEVAQTGKKGFFQSCKDLLTDLLTFPDHHVGWLPYAYRQAARHIRRSPPDCIYSSGGPWTSHILAIWLKRRFKYPVVLDFRDPWAVNPDLGHRGRLFRRLSVRAEAYCIRHADRVVLNTAQLREDFVRRYPREPTEKFTTITNGFEDLAPREPPTPGGRMKLVHAGEIYLSRNPAAFLQAVRDLIRGNSIAADAIEVQLIGGCAMSPEVVQLLAERELRGVIHQLARVPHKTALEYQRAADVLILFQMEFPLQIPRKLFEYMSMRKPVLAITESHGATASMVRDSGVGVVAEPQVASIAAALAQLYRQWQAKADHLADEARIEPYRNSHLALRLRAVLHAAAGKTVNAEESALSDARFESRRSDS